MCRLSHLCNGSNQRAFRFTLFLALSVVAFSYNATAIDEREYFVSTASATWDNAQEECRRVFGENSSLAAIESEYENNVITRQLGSNISGTSWYWTGGMYKSLTNKFVWSATGNEVPTGEGWSYNPWAPEQPPSHSATDTRTTLVQEKQFYSDWSTAPGSHVLRFICQREATA